MIKPYYQQGTCRCGCGATITSAGKRFISGHNLKIFQHTQEQARKIGEAQKKAWSNKRKRLPVGTTTIDHDGYTRVKVHKGSGRWYPEHRMVVENKIGRQLLKSELVHHINKNRRDNREENLFKCESKSHHNKIESTYDDLCESLINKGIIAFSVDEERYICLV
jgi:hypothetical protein